MHRPAPGVCAAILACLLLPSAGCIVAAAAAAGSVVYGAISYHQNEATMDVQNDLPTVFAACKAALRELAFPVDDTQQPGATEGTLYAGEAKVVVERQPGNLTRVRVRVGTFDTDDNKRRAGLILEATKKRL